MTITMTKLKSPLLPNVPTSIGFRLEESSRQVLAERAARLGVSPHELARYYVLQALNEAEERRVQRENMETLQREIAAGRKDLSIATWAILQASGKIKEDEASSWVKTNLNLPCSPSPSH